MRHNPSKKEYIIDTCVKKYNEKLNMDEWDSIIIGGSNKDT